MRWFDPRLTQGLLSNPHCLSQIPWLQVWKACLMLLESGATVQKACVKMLVHAVACAIAIAWRLFGRLYKRITIQRVVSFYSQWCMKPQKKKKKKCFCLRCLRSTHGPFALQLTRFASQNFIQALLNSLIFPSLLFHFLPFFYVLLFSLKPRPPPPHHQPPRPRAATTSSRGTVGVWGGRPKWPSGKPHKLYRH